MKLEVKDLHVSVEDKEILKGVSITFEQGKVVALMGPNGSGKSTLANAIMGNPKYKITSGTSRTRLDHPYSEIHGNVTDKVQGDLALVTRNIVITMPMADTMVDPKYLNGDK